MTVPFDMMTDLSDDALIVRFANGDPVAAQALTARLLPRVLAHAQRLTGHPSDAEDIAQEAMLRLWQIAPKWRPGEAQVSTWLYTVVGNLCVDRLRKTARVVIGDVPDAADDAPGVDTVMQQKARADALQNALMELPARQRQAVVLRHIEGLGNPQIARIMDTGVEAVESLIARARRGLTAQLNDRKEELGYVD